MFCFFLMVFFKFFKSVFLFFVEGSYNGWVEDYKILGLFFVCNVLFIEIVCYLCGDVKVVGGIYSENEDSFYVIVYLEILDKRCELFYK